MEIKQNLDARQLHLIQKLIHKESLTHDEEIELKVISKILNDYYPKIDIKVVQHDEILISSNKPVHVYTDNSNICFVAGTNVTVHK